MKMTRIFLDTNFLIASQIQLHHFHERAKELLARFYAENYVPLAHYLIFDEFWYVLQGLQKNRDVSAIKKSTGNILNFENFKLLKTHLTEKELISTLDLMGKYRLKPRDALIVNVMKKEKIGLIATFDGHFENIPGIRVMK